MTKSEKGLIFILLLVGGLSAMYFRGLEIQNKFWEAESQEQEVMQKIYQDSFGQLKLLGKSAVIYDPIKKESIFFFHENTVRPIASITKVMTAIAALEAMPESTIVSIAKESLSEEGDSGLYLYEKWTLKDLVSFMLVVSSNDAAKAVALARSGDFSSFVEEMNKKAADLNLTRTKFYNETGLDLDVENAGAVSSAREVAELISYAFLSHADIFKVTSKPEVTLVSESGLEHKAQNTDNLLSSLNNILASKTGYTDLAGGNLAVVFKTPAGNILSAVILGSTLNGRFGDIEQLIEAGSKYKDAIISHTKSDGQNTL